MAMNDAQFLLLAARTLISDPKDWAQGSQARDKRGKAVKFDATQAVSFCPVAAMAFCGGLDHVPFVSKAWRALNLVFQHDSCPLCSLDEHNDLQSTTHATVMRLFDEAIEEAR